MRLVLNKVLEGVQIREQEMDELAALLEYLVSRCLKTCFHFSESKDTYDRRILNWKQS